MTPYLTTKLPNRHQDQDRYLLEACIKVAMISFTVMQKGPEDLTDKLLGLVRLVLVREERPDLARAHDTM